MALTDEQWTVAQAWIGTSEPRDTFEERFARLGESLDNAINEALLSLITKTASTPSSISLPSGLSISQGENIRTWRDVLNLFRSQGGTDGNSDGPGGTRVVRRVRPSVR